MKGWSAKARLASGLIGVVVTLATPGAHVAAQDVRESAAARALFKEGVELADANDWQGAADRFRRALEIHPTPQIRFNLARSLSHAGALVEASEHLARILRADGVPASVRREAEGLKDEVDKRVGALVVRIAGARADAVVELDDRRMPDATLGVEVPADPGWHVVRLVRGDDELDRHEIEVPEGQRVEVELQVPAAVPPPRKAIRAEPEAPAVERGTSRHPAHLYGPVTLGALGLAGVAVALGSLAVEECEARSPDGRCQSGRRIRSGPTAAYGAAGGAAIVGAFLWYVLGAPEGDDESDDESIAIDLGPRGAAIRGRF